MNIKNLEDLIGGKILKQQVTRLTEPGENYGSLMLSVSITTETPNGTEELHTVAKMVPPNEMIWKIFNVPVTFPNEVAFYKDIVPLLQNFQREHGVEEVIDFSPKYLGSRLSLDPNSTQVDSDGVLLLENLKVDNYTIVDRTQGVDFDTAKLILADLAHFHAVPLALKIQKPEVFQKEVVPHLLSSYPREKTTEDMKDKFQQVLISKFEELKDEKIRQVFNRDKEETRELFATIVHNDCWVNNNMVKFENGKAVKNKLVDYQGCLYGSPARDVVFFLFSSVKTDVLEQYSNELIRWYHQVFISVLEELHCDTTPFTLKALEEELALEAKNSEFSHVIFMLFPIFADKKDVSDISDLSPDNFLKQEPSDLHRKKLKFIVDEFVKRNWI